jgi:hypothetical protein
MKAPLGVSISLLLLCALPFTGLCGIRGPGKYSGIVIFDRWDTCHLYSGAYVMEISEKVKESLRPFAGQAMEINAQEVFQPMNPGDGLITKLQVVGAAPEPGNGGFGHPPMLEGLTLKAIPNFAAQGGDELIIRLRNSGESKREIDTDALAPTLFAKKQDMECLNPSDGASYVPITRTNVNFMSSQEAGDSCLVNGRGRTVKMRLLPGLAISPKFDLAPGQSIEIRLQFELSVGEYQFLAGYGGGVHAVRAIASNILSFDVDEAGKPHLVRGEKPSEEVRPRRGSVCGTVTLPDGSAAADTKVFVWTAPMARSQPRAANMTITKADGRFRMDSVLEGQYVISAVRVSPHSVLAGASGDRGLADPKILDLPSFPENCSLQLTVRPLPTYSVHGRTEAGDPAAPSRTARLILVSGDAFPFETTATIQADGSYEFTDVPPGHYQFFAGSMGSAFDVKSDREVNFNIKWPDQKSAQTGRPSMPAEFNETMIIVELGILNQAEQAYGKTYGKGFTKSLDVLGPPPKWYHETADRAGLFNKLGTPFLTDEDATHFTEFGYQFTYSAGEPDAAGKISRYTVSVRPTRFGETGKRNFFTDESGVIHARDSDSPAIKEDRAVDSNESLMKH